MTVKKIFTLGLAGPFTHGIANQDVTLKGKHFFLFLRFGMIEAQKMQDSVRRQKQQFIEG